MSKIVATALALVVCACGHPSMAPRSRLTPKEIVVHSKPAIVRIEVGQERVGTGFVIDKTGLVATNLHVVVGSDDINVKMLDGTNYHVQRVIAYDKDHDLALLDIDPPKPIPVLALGDSDAAAPGDPVLAIGNPLGVLDYTVSDGLLSAVRVISPDYTLLQISAPISQGSSGGPLFNNYGEVIGIVNAFLGGGQNLNFAIPSKYLKLLSTAAAHPETPAEFKAETLALIEGGGGGKEECQTDIKVTRHVPDHDLKILDGCSKENLADIAQAIGQAIELGAPLYNDCKIEACFLIYQGVVVQYDRETPCAGLRAALEDGLKQADAVPTMKEKAWALRDTFDGLLDVIVRKARSQGAVP